MKWYHLLVNICGLGTLLVIPSSINNTKVLAAEPNVTYTVIARPNTPHIDSVDASQMRLLQKQEASKIFLEEEKRLDEIKQAEEKREKEEKAAKEKAEKEQAAKEKAAKEKAAKEKAAKEKAAKEKAAKEKAEEDARKAKALEDEQKRQDEKEQTELSYESDNEGSNNDVEPVGSEDKSLSVVGSTGGLEFDSNGLLVESASGNAQTVINLLLGIPGHMNGAGYHASTGVDTLIDQLSTPEAVYVIHRIEGAGFGQTGDSYAGEDSPASHQAFVNNQVNRRFGGSVHQLLKEWGTFSYGGY